MAAPVLLDQNIVLSVPFVVHKMSFTAGATATAFNHLGPGIPDIVIARNDTTNPTATEVAIYSLTATQFTLDCEAASGTVVVHLIWFNQASGGIS